jgi:hypothetical protein
VCAVSCLIIHCLSRLILQKQYVCFLSYLIKSIVVLVSCQRAYSCLGVLTPVVNSIPHLVQIFPNLDFWSSIPQRTQVYFPLVCFSICIFSLSKKRFSFFLLLLKVLYMLANNLQFSCFLFVEFGCFIGAEI